MCHVIWVASSYLKQLIVADAFTNSNSNGADSFSLNTKRTMFSLMTLVMVKPAFTVVPGTDQDFTKRGGAIPVGVRGREGRSEKVLHQTNLKMLIVIMNSGVKTALPLLVSVS